MSTQTRTCLAFGLLATAVVSHASAALAQDWPQPQPRQRYDEPAKPRDSQGSRYDDDAPRRNYNDDDAPRRSYNDDDAPRRSYNDDAPARRQEPDAPRRSYNDDAPRPRYDEPGYDRRADAARFNDAPPEAGGQVGLAPSAGGRPADASSEKLFSSGSVAILGGIGGSEFVQLGLNAGDLLFSVGFALSVNTALAGAVGMGGTGGDVGFSLATSIAYMAYDSHPLAFGPELDIDTRIAPSPAITGHTEFRPGLALWYAPFRAPLYFGTMVGFRIVTSEGADPGFSTAYPGLRIRWGF